MSMLTGKGKYILTALFFAVSFWFWGVLAFGTLWFLETTQFFPYTGSHLAAALCYPGGISEYVSEFFVQFFHLRLCAAAGRPGDVPDEEVLFPDLRCPEPAADHPEGVGGPHGDEDH